MTLETKAVLLRTDNKHRSQKTILRACKKIQQSQSTKEMKTLSRKLNAKGLVGFQAKSFEQNFPEQ